MESGEHATPLWAHNLTGAGKAVCMQAICLHAWAHISAKLDRIRKMKVSIEFEEHNRPIWVHNTNQARKRACMHAMCWCAQAHIPANLGQIHKIEICTEFGRHAGHDYDVWALCDTCTMCGKLRLLFFCCDVNSFMTVNSFLTMNSMTNALELCPMWHTH